MIRPVCENAKCKTNENIQVTYMMCNNRFEKLGEFIIELTYYYEVHGISMNKLIGDVEILGSELHYFPSNKTLGIFFFFLFSL